MKPMPSLFSQHAFLIWPTTWLGIMTFMVFVGVIFWANWYWRSNQRNLDGYWGVVFGGLFLITPLSALIFGIRLPLWGGLPLPDVALEASGKYLMIFAALPVLLGGWLLGPQSASVLGALSGLSLAFFATHSPFTILEMASLGLLFSIVTRQRFRTWVFGALRRPFLATLVLSAFYPFIYIVGAFVWPPGALPENLDFAISNVRSATVAIGGSLLVAGGLTEIVALTFPKLIATTQELRPSPAETSLKSRFLRYVIWWTFSLMILLILVNWFVAGKIAKDILRDQMVNLAETTTDQIPNFLNTGQSLIKQYATDLSGTLDSSQEAEKTLKKAYRSAPFFSKLFVLDADANQLLYLPQGETVKEILSPIERDGLEYALAGIPVQVYAIPSLDERTPAEISFMGTIMNEEDTPQGILVGRVDLTANPFAQTIVTGLQGMSD